MTDRQTKRPTERTDGLIGKLQIEQVNAIQRLQWIQPQIFAAPANFCSSTTANYPHNNMRNCLSFVSALPLLLPTDPDAKRLIRKAIEKEKIQYTAEYHIILLCLVRIKSEF